MELAITHKEMLTLDKLKIYKTFDGDSDGWARAKSKNDSSMMTDNDWALIEELRNAFFLISEGHASLDFKKSAEQRLLSCTDGEATRQAFRQL